MIKKQRNQPDRSIDPGERKEKKKSEKLKNYNLVMAYLGSR